MLDMDLINAAMVRQNTPEQAAAAAAANAKNAKKGELNQDDFLTLMITQLKNQDPFKPMDPAQYVGQLAQFSVIAVQCFVVKLYVVKNFFIIAIGVYDPFQATVLLARFYVTLVVVYNFRIGQGNTKVIKAGLNCR